ncbi:MAG: MATE family efflux transporter [Gammaproteobacteria bacterium]|nr:MATE family efflux transporter [Gammaproteobacteria bacterium]
MSDNNQDLTRGKIGAQLIGLTIPQFLGIASMIVASMVDAIYIGILGARELAAYSFTYPLIMALFSLSMGLGNGASSIIARAEGAGEGYKVKRFATHALLLTLILVMALIWLARSCQSAVFSLMGADAEIHPLIMEYFGLWVLGLVFYTLPMVASNILRALGQARMPGIVMAGSSLLQMILAPLMIFGLLGLPELGFLGAAWAGLITGFVRMVAMLWLVVRSHILLPPGGSLFNGLLISARDILRIGFPSMISGLIGPFSMGVVIWILAEHGPDVVAGFGITSRIEMLVTMVLMSLSASVGPFVGQNWGARRISRVYQALRLSYGFCFFWGVVCLCCLGPFGDLWVSLINDQPALVTSAAWYLWIVPFTYAFTGIGAVSISTFIALGYPLPGLTLSFLRMVAVYIPLALLFNYYWGYIGVFVATAMSNVLMGAIAWFWCGRFIRTKSA